MVDIGCHDTPSVDQLVKPGFLAVNTYVHTNHQWLWTGGGQHLQSFGGFAAGIIIKTCWFYVEREVLRHTGYLFIALAHPDWPRYFFARSPPRTSAGGRTGWHALVRERVARQGSRRIPPGGES